MPVNPTAENVLGTIGENFFLIWLTRDMLPVSKPRRHLSSRTYFDYGTVVGTICWTVQLIPQVWKSWRTKSTDGLSEYLM